MSQDQLLEVYGIDEERYVGITPQITVNSTLVKKLNVNTATFKELLAHPYLEYDQVKSLVNYRETIGAFKDVNSIPQLPHFSEKDVKRLVPYLSTQ